MCTQKYFHESQWKGRKQGILNHESLDNEFSINHLIQSTKFFEKFVSMHWVPLHNMSTYHAVTHHHPLTTILWHHFSGIPAPHKEQGDQQ